MWGHNVHHEPLIKHLDFYHSLLENCSISIQKFSSGPPCIVVVVGQGVMRVLLHLDHLQYVVHILVPIIFFELLSAYGNKTHFGSSGPRVLLGVVRVDSL